MAADFSVLQSYRDLGLLWCCYIMAGFFFFMILVLFCIVGSSVSRFAPSSSCCCYCLVLICEEHVRTPEKTVGKLYGLDTLGVQNVLSYKTQFQLFLFSAIFSGSAFCITSPACVCKSPSYSSPKSSKDDLLPILRQKFLGCNFWELASHNLNQSTSLIFPNCIDFCKADWKSLSGKEISEYSCRGM